MAKTTTEINTELVYYQCCLADLAYKYIVKEENGHQNIDCMLSNLIYGTTLLESLKCPDIVLNMEYLTQDELEIELEKLAEICGCVACDDPTQLSNDTL